jgi:hypothetical protein
MLFLIHSNESVSKYVWTHVYTYGNIAYMVAAQRLHLRDFAPGQFRPKRQSQETFDSCETAAADPQILAFAGDRSTSIPRGDLVAQPLLVVLRIETARACN